MKENIIRLTHIDYFAAPPALVELSLSASLNWSKSAAFIHQMSAIVRSPDTPRHRESRPTTSLVANEILKQQLRALTGAERRFSRHRADHKHRARVGPRVTVAPRSLLHCFFATNTSDDGVSRRRKAFRCNGLRRSRVRARGKVAAALLPRNGAALASSIG